MGARSIRRNSGARRLARSYARRVALAALLLAFPLAASAAEFLVTNTNDFGAGSLRQAIEDLNDLGAVVDEQHRIVFDDSIADDSVIAILTPLEDIAVDVDIDASDVTNLTLQGPIDLTFLRTDTTRVTIIDMGTVVPNPVNSAMGIGGGDTLGFDTSEGLTIEVSSNINQVTTAGGTLVKDGLGTLELSGTNTYSFRTLVNDGTLILSGTPPFFGDMDIEENGTLVFDTAIEFTLNGALNGSGELVKRNNDITLLGGGAFTGLTRVESGTLTDASGVIQGDVILDDPASANLVFDVGADQTRTHSGNISGTGDVAKRSAGTLTLLGSNSYVGRMFLDEGTLIGSSASLPGEIVASTMDDDTMLSFDTTLIFDQSSTGTFAGNIQDVGVGGLGLSLKKSGTGTLTLSSGYTVQASAGTTISEGRLIIDGMLTTPTTMLAAGATLGGDGGTITAANVDVEGTLSPGPESGPGTLTITGDIDFRAGSVFEVDINELAEGDTIEVGGNARVTGSTMRVFTGSGSYSTLVSHTVLNATGSLTGSFTLENDFAFLDECLGTLSAVAPWTCTPPTGNTLQLHLLSNSASISSFATTPNQLTVGEVLDEEQAALPAGNDLDTVFAAIQVMELNEVQPMLDAIGGEPLSAFPTAQLAIGERLTRTVHRRVRDAVWGEPAAFYDPWAATPAANPTAQRRSAASPIAALAAPNNRRAQSRGRRAYAGPLRTFEGNTGVGGWIDGWGSLGDLEGDGSSADVETQSFGATVGVDYRFGERISAGLAGGYANVDIELDGRASQGDADLAQGALYAGYVDPRFHVTASGRYGHAWNDSERRIAFSGFDRTAEASFESQDVGARAEIGANALRLGPVDVAPLAAFDWAQLRRDDFTESGADSLDLVVEDETLTSLLSSLGGSLRGFFDLGDDVAMAAELRGFWLHEFGDVERPIRARLAGAAVSGSFEILGAELPRDRILAGLGWSASIGDVVRVFADYDVALGSGLLQHEATLAVRIHF